MATDLVNPISGITPSQLSQPFTRGTAVNTTSGTAIDFTSIPNWVKRITLSLNAVSTSGTSLMEVRIGSGSVDATGYESTCNFGVTTSYFATSTTGFILLPVAGQAAAYNQCGAIVLNNVSGNIWQSFSLVGSLGTQVTTSGSGIKTLSGTLDRIRLTTQNGTDTFDNGSVNIFYE